MCKAPNVKSSVNSDLIKKLRGEVLNVHVAEYLTYGGITLSKSNANIFKIGYEIGINKAIAEIRKYQLGDFAEELDALLKKYDFNYSHRKEGD